MSDVPVTPQSPLATRLLAYLQERFPPGPIATVSVVTTLATAAAVAAASGGPVRLDAGLGLLALAHFLTLLVLRVLDEHKDFERDRAAYPGRALSRGVVTLRLLRKVAWVAGALALAASAALGPLPLAAHGVVLVFALLMAREFFLGDLLKRDVFLYAAAHQPINPLITAWLLLGVGARGVHGLAAVEDHAPVVLGWFLLAQAALGFGFEVSRKLWTPEEERPDLVDSYSSHPIGPRGAGLVAVLLLLVGAGATSVFAWRTGLPVWLHAVVALGALLAAGTVGGFAARPYPGASKKLQGGVGLGSLVLQVGLVAAAVVARSYALGGAAWGWGPGA
jgi:4-hydroxybenzoate polyprenyltransferase